MQKTSQLDDLFGFLGEEITIFCYRPPVVARGRSLSPLSPRAGGFVR